MDERLLNDLLECSVCLERLDTSSRVLPCQHTFCLKCLQEIVASHCELRCPECRVLVEARVDELPRNVLLQRILEGVRKTAGRQNTPQHVVAASTAAARNSGETKPTPHARALYDYSPKEQGDLAFKKGDMIQLQKRVDAFWYRGECSGRVGIFPVSYVQVLVPLPAQTALCKALYDFRMSAPDEEGCLAFDKDAVISVLRRVDDNWAEGRLDGRVGIFPIAFVQLNQAARDLIHTHSAMVAGRTIPLVPEHSRQTHSENRPHAQQTLNQQQMTLSTPIQTQNYQHIAMSQSHPAFHQPINPLPQQIALPHPAGTTVMGHLIHRNLEQPKPMMDLIQFTNIQNKSGVQSMMRIQGYDNQVRVGKYDYSVTPRSQAKRQDYVVNFSSDSSSTPSNSVSNSTPNSSSDSTEPSSPISPENTINAMNHTVLNDTETTSLLNDSSTSRTLLNDSSNSRNERSLLSDSSNSRNDSSNVRTLNDSSNSRNLLNESSSSRNESSNLRMLESSSSTNTSLNVSLPPVLDTPNTASTNSQNVQMETPKKISENAAVKTIGSYKPAGDLLSFSLTSQAAATPLQGKEATPSGYTVTPRLRDNQHREREKRNSLTPGNIQTHNLRSNTNRHSAEVSGPIPGEACPDRERRRRRSRSGDRALPAPYVALYPYKPHKSDELELKKGVIYTVTERCQDGWYKGCSTRTLRCGVFPGNYVAPVARKHHDKMLAHLAPGTQKPAPQVAAPPAPAAPPRVDSPPPGQPHSIPWVSGAQPQPKSAEKPSKDRASKQDKAGVSLMKRLAAMKKCKSPPPGMDNPVFEDCSGQAVSSSGTRPSHPVHVRSGSCPSQLLQAAPAPEPGARPAGGSATVVARGRHARVTAAAAVAPVAAHTKHHNRGDGAGAAAAAAGASHRKSQSLDAGSVAREHRKQLAAPLHEKFRCVVPYPPNSEYELELQLHDVVVVHRKRGDGWYKGTLQRTGRTGLFPASFVHSCE